MIPFMLIFSLLTVIVGLVSARKFINWDDFRSEAFLSYLIFGFGTCIALPVGACCSVICIILLII